MSADLGGAAVVGIVGGGPAGLMAAEHLARAGYQVTIHDRMRVVGRKFLLAGRGGLNLTHAEPLAEFLARYGNAASFLESAIRAFPPEAVREWSHSLGQPTFVGSTQRVFPEAFHATELLRAWLRRLESLGVTFVRSALVRVNASSLVASSDAGETPYTYDAIVLALGGASWPRLGANGDWVAGLRQHGVEVRDFAPANCGVNVTWSAYVIEKLAGAPLKNVAVSTGFAAPVRGELVITRHGLEGGPIYALGPQLRARASANQRMDLRVDLRPDVASDAIYSKLAALDPKSSLTNRLRKVGLDAAATVLVREFAPNAKSAAELAAAIKGLPIATTGLATLDRAISSSGGVALHEVDENLMLRKLPGVFVAGEMLDWDAPTGGYLLQACFSTGTAAAAGVHEWLPAARVSRCGTGG